jgi:hypothetical protein
LIIIILGILLIGIKAYNYYNYTSEEKFFYKSLKNQIKHNDKNFTIPIGQLTNFNWDTMWLFGPYDYGLKKRKVWIQEKYYTNNCSNAPKLDSGGMWALGFIKNNEICYIIRGKVIGYSKIETKSKFF